MEKIYMEKESVARLVVNAVILLVSLFFLVVICIEHHWGIPLCSAVLFVLLSALGILVELYECIFYDDTHFAVRSFGGTEEVNFADIESVKRRSRANPCQSFPAAFQPTRPLPSLENTRATLCRAFPATAKRSA